VTIGAGLATGSAAISDATPPEVSRLVRVAIQDFQFVPATLTIEAGATVLWTNRDTTTHTVTATRPGLFDSGELSPGRSHLVAFKNAGTFPYVCTLHASMMGTVRVTR
jgi:plastocyanin